MLRLLLIFSILFTNSCVAQNDTAIYLSKKINAKRVYEANNYVDDTLRSLIIDYLKGKHLDPMVYSIDSDLIKSGDTLQIALWDKKGLTKINQMQIKAEFNKENSEQIIGLVGNPGNCGTLYYDTRLRTILGFYYWQ